MENINTKKLVKEIKRLSVLIKQHKNNIHRPHVIGQSGRNPIGAMPAEIEGENWVPWRSQMKLHALKQSVTMLCSLRAHLRGKIHKADSSLEEQEAFLRKREKQWKPFEKVLDVAA